MQTVSEETARPAGHTGWELHYTLLKSVCPAEGLGGQMVYGIRAELLNGRKVLDSCEIRDVTSLYGRARDLLETARRNTVMPCTLKDVLEDALAEDAPAPPVVRKTAGERVAAVAR